MEKIGVVGYGIVGSAVAHGLKKLGHDVKIHDIKHDTRLQDLLNTKICFICVPTPSADSGACDTAIVEGVVSDLCAENYKGIVVIKSTVEPGTTEKLRARHENLNICFVPEFLRERCALSDFVDNHDLCVIGTHSKENYKIIKSVHGNLPDQFVMCSPTEAEMVKYFNNIYNATLITFANNFYEVCEGLGVNYTNVKNAVVKREHINDCYLDCNKNFRGFGGACLPKDTKAIANLVKEKKLKSSFFQDLMDHNNRYITTVFEGMRMGDET
jgi:UDPglucose 6-dehydrogenase